MRVVLSFLCLLLVGTITAQIQEVPLQTNPTIRNYAAKHPADFSKAPGDTITIPFLDDFSYSGPYPSSKIWDNRDAYVNTGLAVQPPTYGVATLDGLNDSGMPHGSGSGTADKLTSKPIYMSSFTAGSNVYLSFFYQPRGFGDKPESTDSLIVEFKNNTDTWDRVTAFAGIPSSAPSDSIPPFQQYSVHINAAKYLFDGFQFRFKNIASLTGSVDHWHIDYVRVTTNTTNFANFNDVSFTRKPNPILKDYYAMPWSHFKVNKLSEVNLSYRLDLFNHFSSQKSLLPSTVLVSEDITSSILMSDNIFNTNSGSIPLGTIQPGQHETVVTGYQTANIVGMTTQLDAFDNEEKVTVITEYTIAPTGQDANFPMVLTNDTVRVQAVFDNYFAYDDGEAEVSIVGARQGDQVAVKYHTTVPDTLRAIQMYIPHINGDVTGQRFNLKVWLNDLNSTPIYQADFLQPIYVDSINGWTTYSLDTAAVALPVGDFYVGWQQASQPTNPNKAIPVGYDRSNPDKAQFNFQNIGGGWLSLSSSTSSIADGAIMIRPIVGNRTPFTTNTKPVGQGHALALKIYPNPVQNQLFVQLENGEYQDYNYQLFNALGQLIHQNELTDVISVGDLHKGLYFLKIRNTRTNQTINHKFVKL